MRNKAIIFTLLTAVSGLWSVAGSQEVLTLQECHRRALEANKGIKMSEEKVAEMEAMKKVALWQMLPKLTANGVYTWM